MNLSINTSCSITFMSGFGIEMVCQPLFRDKQMSFYRSSYFSDAIASLINLSESSVDIG